MDTPGTAMAGLDCAEVSEAAWPTLLPGIRGTVTVSDAETRGAMRELAARGLAIGDSGASTLAALHKLRSDDELLAVVSLDRVLLIATEGPTDPDGYREAVGLADGRVSAPLADIPVRRNTLLLAAAMAVYSSVLQLVAAVSSITFVLVSGVEGLLGLGPAIFLVASGLAAVPAGRLDGPLRAPAGDRVRLPAGGLRLLADRARDQHRLHARGHRRLRADRRRQRDRAADPHRRRRHVSAGSGGRAASPTCSSAASSARSSARRCSGRCSPGASSTPRR